VSNQKKSILLVCPKFGLGVNALGAHTYLFARELQNFKEVHVLTSTGEKWDALADIQVYQHNGSWSFWKLLKTCSKLRKIKFDQLFLQYVPHLYGRAGINLGVMILLLYLKVFTKIKIEIMYHELFYPIQFNPKALILHFIHQKMLFISILAGNQYFCSCHKVKSILERQFFFRKKRMSLLPISSTVDNPSLNNTEIENLRLDLGIKSDDLVIGSLGNFHPSKNYPLIFEVLAQLERQNKRSFKFIFVGVTKNEILQNINESLHYLLDKIILAQGKLDDYQVRLNMELMDIFIGYFSDGVSLRRSSIIAAMQSGLRVVTTKSKWTDTFFENILEFYLLPVDQDNFKIQSMRILTQLSKKNKAETESVRWFYQNHLDWKVTTAKYMENSAHFD